MHITLALVPVFLLIATGHVMRRINFPGEAFWSPTERFIYFFLFPAMLIERLTYADSQGISLPSLFAAILVAFLLATVLLLFWRRLRRPTGPDFTSIYQGSIRFNSYVGLAAAGSIAGESGFAIAAISMAMMIPIVNILCIGVFSWQVPQAQPGLKGMLKAIFSNPLIIGSLLGLGGNLIGLRFPEPLRQVLEMCGDMALPLGLICVGAALNLRALEGQGRALGFTLVAKLLLFPLLFVGCGWMFGLSTESLEVFIILGTLPTATASYILARQLGGNASLMAGIISGQTLVAMASMPLLIPVLHRWLL